MAFRLGGRNSLAYVGVEPLTPPNMVVINRPPTINDSQNFNIGTFWVVPSTGTPPEELWILISLVGGIATWVQLYPSNAGGASQFVTDAGIANESGGVINIAGGLNINTAGSGDTVTINLDDSIHLPHTTSGGGQGALFLGGDSFLHDFGANSTFVGELAGSLTQNAADNTGIGFHALTNIDSTSEENTAVGSEALDSLTTGTNCTALGFGAGTAYTTETFNLVLDNAGRVGDNNTIKIGNSADHLNCFIAGIFGATVGPTNAQVFIDSTGLLGTIGGGTPSSSQSFLALVPTTVTYPSSPVTQQFLGADAALNIINDSGGNVFPGDGLGAAATFTAPVTGMYQFNYYLTMNGADGVNTFIYLVTTNRTYFKYDQNINAFANKTIPLSVVADMNSGDTATFGFTFSISGGANYTIVPGNTMPFNLSPTTWISGFLIT